MNLEIRVLNGLHRGTKFSLGAFTVDIGSASDSSIILLDPGISNSHMRFYLSEDGRLMGEARADGVVLADGTTLSDPHEFSAGMMLCIEGVWISIDHPGAPWVREPIDYSAVMRDQMSRLGSSANSLDEETALNQVLSNEFQPNSTFNKRMTFAVLGGISTCAVVGVVAALLSLPQAKQEVANLSPVAVVSASTNLTPQTDTDKALTAADSDASKKTVLKSLTEKELSKPRHAGLGGTAITDPVAEAAAANQLPFQIRAVAGGAQGWVALDSGERLYVGGSTDGYRLVAIENNTLRFVGPTDVTVNW